MRLLDRYLLRELLLPLGYCLSGFLLFWVTFDLVKDMEAFESHQVPWGDIVRYYLARTPEQLVVILPVALLLALLYSLSNHARHQELVAMRAAGLGLWRIAAPYLGVGAVLSGFVLYLNEAWVPRCAERADDIYQGKGRQKGGSEARIRRQLVVKNERDHRLWNISAFNLDTGEMANPYVEWILPDGLHRLIIARRAEPAAEGWTFHDVSVITFHPQLGTNDAPTQMPRLTLPEFTETPALFRSEVKVSGLTRLQAAKGTELSIQEIRDYLQLHPQLPPEREGLLHTQLHGRLAEPWTCLVVVLVAVPFGAAPGRRNVFVGVANSIFICFSYFILMKLGLALGTGGYVPGWLAAWLPNGLFAAVGVGLTHRVR